MRNSDDYYLVLDKEEINVEGWREGFGCRGWFWRMYFFVNIVRNGFVF